MTKKELGDRVWAHRVSRNMRQGELSVKIGMSRASVSNIERGSQEVTLNAINKIAAAFGITTFELMYAAMPAVTHPVRRAPVQGPSSTENK